MSRTAPISLIIVTYNNKIDTIKSCVESVLASNPKPKEIIIVDNGYNPGISSLVRKIELKHYKHILLLKNKDNMGFSKGINKGMEMASQKYYVLLNPDTKIINHASFGEILKCHINKQAGIVGGICIDDNGNRHNSFYRLPKALTAIFEFSNVKRIFPNNNYSKKFYYINEKIKFSSQSFPVEGVSGAFMSIDKRVVEKIGNLDENYFLYLEDIDFCTRAQKHKIKVYVCPNAVAFHRGGESSEKKRGRINYNAWVKSRYYFFSKNLKCIEQLIVLPIFSIDTLINRIINYFRDYNNPNLKKIQTISNQNKKYL